MPTNSRGGSRSGNRRGTGPNNNPEGRNQYSGMAGRARQNPLATAAAVGGAVAAGVFLWSRRNQISDQIGNLADQMGEWRDGLELEHAVGETGSGERTTASGSGSRRSQADISEEALTLKEIGERP